eukprot:m.495735 g.495735  ORF g.495735 m.495735 type:complete len:702 (+) comp21802_c2_seq10:132-2237(+)
MATRILTSAARLQLVRNIAPVSAPIPYIASHHATQAATIRALSCISTRADYGCALKSEKNSFISKRRHASVGGTEEYQSMYRKSISEPEEFWADEARTRVSWHRDFDKAKLVDLSQGHIEWFSGGKLNAAENCVDRHLEAHGDQVALVYEADEPNTGYNVTYKELHENVCRLANVLKSRGVGKGDVVCIYMPMTPHIVYTMLACARIGAIHSVVFAGFSADALAARIQDSHCRTVVTADEGMRGGKSIPLKHTVDEAVAKCPDVSTVLVQRRTGTDAVAMGPIDVCLDDAMHKADVQCPVEVMDSEDPLFILYTSGSTGAPKGLTHTTGGYLTYASMTHDHIFDYKKGDVYACVADAGWITGHTYVVYGPLMNGATTVLFESIPTYPDAGRYWEMVERLNITQFYTAPTAIRLLIKSGDEYVHKYDRSSLRVLGSVGEPINPEAWKWYSEVVGESKVPIVDTWWQTETGGIMMTPLPADTDAKPGAAMRPFYGVEPVLLDPQGNELHGNDQRGALGLKQIPPGMSRSIYGDHDRFKKVYYEEVEGYYVTGDGAWRDDEGHYWITGRVDDVINVSGHRLGTAEVESAIVEHPDVAESAVVGFPHDIKGQGVYAYVTLKDNVIESDTLLQEIAGSVRKTVGPFAKPDVILISSALPKTRSGKIMRRVLRKIAANDTEELGDLSTLADPSVIDELMAKALALHK